MTTTEVDPGAPAAPPTEPDKIDSAVPADPPTAPVPTSADGAEPEPHPVPERVAELMRRADEARMLRQLATNPDVVALGVERMRAWVDRLGWTSIALGLAFTMVNVQTFAARDAEPWSLPWLVAWVLDPGVSLLLVAVLIAEQVAARWLIEVGPWLRAARWVLLAATYAMNTWSAWFPPGGIWQAIPSLILLHSVPPLLVFFAVEAMTDAREAMTRAVHRAADEADHLDRSANAEPGAEAIERAVIDLMPRLMANGLGEHIADVVRDEVDRQADDPAPVPPPSAPIPTEAELRTMGRDKLRAEARRIGGVATRGDVEPLRVRVLAARGFAPEPHAGTGADADAAPAGA